MTHLQNDGLKLISRREFIAGAGVSSVALLAGCAVNPVTNKKQFMLISEKSEIDMDKKWAPHQFSADYGSVRDAKLNNYINEVGLNMAKFTHRPHMPYNFRVVNSVVVNGYTFPAGRDRKSVV